MVAWDDFGRSRTCGRIFFVHKPFPSKSTKSDKKYNKTEAQIVICLLPCLVQRCKKRRRLVCVNSPSHGYQRQPGRRDSRNLSFAFCYTCVL